MTGWLAAAAVVAATVLAGTSLIPQIVKLLRTRDTAGVSSTWPAIGLVLNGAWTAYLFHQGLVAATVSTMLMVVFFSVVLWALRRAGSALRQSILRGTICLAALVLLTVVGGWLILGTVLGFAHVLQVAPALLQAYRTDRPTGIAPATWWITGAEGSLWGYYGWFHADTPIMIFATTVVVTSALMLVRYQRIVQPSIVAD